MSAFAQRLLAAGVMVCFIAGATAGLAAAGEEPLAAEATAMAQAAQRQYGAGYTTRIDAARHIVYVSAVDPRALDRVVGLLGEAADRQRQFLFPQPLPWNVLVVLPTVADYRKSGPPANASGHYRASTRTLESISFSDVLLHEFTHALHHADQAQAGQRHPVWITEGLATLFQRATWRDGRPVVAVEPGLVALQDEIGRKKAPTLAALCAMDQKAFMADAAVCYPAVRYVMFYLYRHNKLQAFYDAYKAGYAADLTGAAALARVLGKPLDEADAAWRDWVLKLEPPWTPAHPPQAHLGVKMSPAEGGVEVTGFVPRAAAERAGRLRLGDVILSVAGQATPTAKDLTTAVQGCRPGEIVDVEVIRDGQIETVKQLLGVMPP